MKSLQKPRSGFTLVEIMVIVGILAIVSALAMPNYLRARKRSQASRMLDDLRMIDGAIDQYAVETTKQSGAPINWPDIQGNWKTNSAIYSCGGKDLIGNAYSDGALVVGTVPKLNAATYTKFSDVTSADFWSPFYP